MGSQINAHNWGMERAIQNMVEGLSNGEWILQSPPQTDILQTVRTAGASGSIHKLAKGVWFCGTTDWKVVMILKETRGPSSMTGKVLRAFGVVQTRLGRRKPSPIEFSYDLLANLRGKPEDKEPNGTKRYLRGKVRGKNRDESRRIEMLNALPRQIRQTMLDSSKRKHSYDPVMVMFSISIAPPTPAEVDSDQEDPSGVDGLDMPDVIGGLASFYD